MLFLLFQLGADRYALPARDVAEVLPLVALKGVPGAQTSGAARNPPAATIGPAVQSALSGIDGCIVPPAQGAFYFLLRVATPAKDAKSPFPCAVRA